MNCFVPFPAYPPDLVAVEASTCGWIHAMPAAFIAFAGVGALLHYVPVEILHRRCVSSDIDPARHIIGRCSASGRPADLPRLSGGRQRRASTCTVLGTGIPTVGSIKSQYGVPFARPPGSSQRGALPPPPSPPLLGMLSMRARWEIATAGLGRMVEAGHSAMSHQAPSYVRTAPPPKWGETPRASCCPSRTVGARNCRGGFWLLAPSVCN